MISKLKIGASPNTFLEIKSAVTDAAIVERSTSTEKLLCSSSSEKRTPAKGALNAAASPALAPHVINSFSSIFDAFGNTRKSLTRHCAKLYGRAFAPKRQSRANRKRAAHKFRDQYLPPVLAEYAVQFSLHLRNSAAADHRLPAHKLVPIIEHEKKQVVCMLDYNTKQHGNKPCERAYNYTLQNKPIPEILKPF